MSFYSSIEERIKLRQRSHKTISVSNLTTYSTNETINPSMKINRRTCSSESELDPSEAFVHSMSTSSADTQNTISDIISSESSQTSISSLEYTIFKPKRKNMKRSTLRANKVFKSETMTSIDFNNDFNSQTTEQTMNIIESDHQLSDHLEEEDNSFEKSVTDDNPYYKLQNKMIWTDRDYQIHCLNNTIRRFESDVNNEFKLELKEMAKKTLNLSTLPAIDQNMYCIIHFDLKGRPHFDFHFLPHNYSQNVEQVTNVDNQVIKLSQMIFQWISI